MSGEDAPSSQYGKPKRLDGGWVVGGPVFWFSISARVYWDSPRRALSFGVVDGSGGRAPEHFAQPRQDPSEAAI